MLPRSTRDTGALGLGFLTDRVLRALKTVRMAQATSADLQTLNQASQLMRELSRNVGPGAAAETYLSFNAVQSFPYAAEALRAVPSALMRDGLRTLFITLADTLISIAGGAVPDPQGVKLVDEFFRRLSETTFQHWSALGDSRLRTPELA